MNAKSAIPSPPENVEYEEFWTGANEGKLLLPRCKDTQQFFWYPRKVSPFTLSNNIEWMPASGRAVIYTFSIMRRADPQYVVAYVRLAEGITIMTNIVECDPDTLKIGDPVTLVMYESQNGQKVPVFKPTE